MVKKRKIEGKRKGGKTALRRSQKGRSRRGALTLGPQKMLEGFETRPAGNFFVASGGNPFVAKRQSGKQIRNRGA